MLDWVADTFFGRSFYRCLQAIQARRPAFMTGHGASFKIEPVSPSPVPRQAWRRCILSIEADGLHLYPANRRMDVHHHFRKDDLRWFGRPEIYRDGLNEMWLHFETEAGWQLVQIRLHKSAMTRFVRAAKDIATPEQNIAYRRQRPYVHYPPTPMQFGDQSIHGAWEVEPEIYHAYLMPLLLVIFDGERVKRTLSLHRIQNVEVMRRLDSPSGDGVVRFIYHDKITQERVALVMADHVPFGAALVEAARRSLETPPIFYDGKKKHDDD